MDNNEIFFLKVVGVIILLLTLISSSLIISSSRMKNNTLKKKIEILENENNKLKRINNFYELALKLYEGYITEEEYNKEIEDNPKKYIVDYSYKEDNNNG